MDTFGMKVKELIKQLEELDPELDILIQEDREGNGYRPLRGVDGDNTGYNSETCHYDIEVGILKLTPDLEEMGYSEEDIQPKPCAILY